MEWILGATGLGVGLIVSSLLLGLGAFTAVASLVVGILFALGQDAILPVFPAG